MKGLEKCLFAVIELTMFEGIWAVQYVAYRLERMIEYCRSLGRENGGWIDVEDPPVSPRSCSRPFSRAVVTAFRYKASLVILDLGEEKERGHRCSS